MATIVHGAAYITGLTALVLGCAPAPIAHEPDLRFASEPPRFAVVGVPYRYVLSLATPERAEYQVRAGPAGMGIDPSGVVSWVPTAEDEGVRAVCLVATASGREFVQEFAIDVAAARVIASFRVQPESGGQTILSGTSSALDGAIVRVAPGSVSEGIDVSVAIVEGAAPPLPSRAAVPLAPALALFPRVPIELELSCPDAAPAWASIDDLHAVVGLAPRGLSGSLRWGGDLTGLVEGMADDEAGVVRLLIEEAAESGWFQPVALRLHRTESPHFRLLWPYAADADVPELAANRFRAQLEEAWTHVESFGCAMPSAKVNVFVGTFTPGLYGFMAHAGVFVNQLHLNDDVSGTLAHELFHVLQAHAWGLGEDFDPAAAWLVEGTAAYVESYVHGSSFRERYGPWDNLPSWGFALGYGFLWFYRHARAVAAFDVCDLLETPTALQEPQRALDEVLDHRLSDRYLSFTVAYAWSRSNADIDGIEETGVSYEPWTASVARRSSEVPLIANDIRYGDAFEFVLDPSIGDVQVRLGAARAEVLRALVLDDTLTPIAQLRLSDPVVVVPSGATERLRVALTALPEHGGPGSEVVGANIRVEPVLRSSCSESGAECSASGPAFDAECCGALICVVRTCVEPGAREGEPCADGSCARGLACRPVGSAGASPTCCARDGDYCEAKADCCGLMVCEGGRCVARTVGESCVFGDCEGASICSEGTCE